MELKKTVKYDGKLKGLHMVDEQLVDMDGEIIDILDIFEKAYGDKLLTCLLLLRLRKSSILMN